MKTERLVFNNADAIPKSNVLDIHIDGVEDVCRWYLEAQLAAQSRIAEVNVKETMIDRIPDVDWIDQAVADWG
jgi:hypothetical protein